MILNPEEIKKETIKAFDSLLCEFAQTYPADFCNRMTNIMELYLFDRIVNNIDIFQQISYIISDSWGNFNQSDNIKIELIILRNFLSYNIRK